MERDTARTALIALLCCVAVVVAASTLPSMIEVDGSDGEGGLPGSGEPPGENGDGWGVPDEVEDDSSDDSSAEPIDPGFESLSICVDALDNWWGFPGLVAGAIGLAYLATRGYDLRMTALVALSLLPVAMLVYLVLVSGCSDPSFGSMAGEFLQPENGSGDGGIGTPGDGELTAPTVLSFLVLAVLGVAIAGGAATLLYSRDADEEPDVQPVDEPGEEERQAALGRAAGRAADRMEASEDFENEVYRAWDEMTAPLSVDRPESSTPGEFAAAAREAGLDAEHVDELTRLFEEVRYGGQPATEERERRAIETLRRIEDEYGDGGADGE